MRTSYSALNTYQTCPLKFKYQEIDKIKVPKSKEAVFGTSVHEAMRFMFTRNPLYPTLDEVLNFFTERWLGRSSKIDPVRNTELNSKSSIGGEVSNGVKLNEEEKENYKKTGLELVKNFYKKNQPWNFNTVDLESRFEFPIENTALKENHIIAGIIDRIDKNSDDEYEIIDYKTASRMPSQEMIDKNLQMSIYHLGIINRWPHLKSKKVKLSFYFLKHNEKISTSKSEQGIVATKNSLIGLIQEILERQKNNDFPPHPSALCDWCGYRPMCPMWKHQYEKTENRKPKTENEIEDIIKEYFEIKETEQKNKKRVAELQTAIHQYMTQEKVERIFSGPGYITRTIKSAPRYDLEKTREILESIGRWKEVLKVDETMLNKIIFKLPPEIQEKFKNAVRETKITKTLTISKNLKK